MSENENSGIKEELSEIKNEIKNLVSFISQGDSSTAVRELLAEKENKLEVLHKSSTTKKTEKLTISEEKIKEYVISRVSELTDLLNSHLDKSYLVRRQLELLLPTPIQMFPEERGKKAGYKIIGKGLSPNVLGASPFPTKISVPKGI